MKNKILTVLFALLFLVLMLSGVVSARWESAGFGSSVTVDDEPTETVWFEESFGSSITLDEPAVPVTFWAEESFGSSITLNGFYYGDWSDWWVMDFIGTNPVISSPSPSNNSVGVSSSLSNISVNINHPDGTSFNWSIELSNGNSSSADGESNGTKICDVNISCGVVDYIWWVNVTDGVNIVNRTFYFTSEACNGSVTTNSSTGVTGSNVTLHGYLSGDGGESCSVGFEYGTTDSYGSYVNYTNETLYRLDYYPTYSYGIWGDGEYIYKIGRTGEVGAYSFDGDSFTELDTVDISGDGFDIWGDGTYIYAVCYDDGVFAFSFDGNSLEEVGNIDSGGDYWDITCDGSYIYTTGGSSGIYAYTFDGDDFTLKDTHDAGGTYTGIFYDNGYIYVASIDGCVYAYTFNENATDEFWLKASYCDVSQDFRRIWANGSDVFTVSYQRIFAFSFDGTTLSLLAHWDDSSENYYGIFSDNTYQFITDEYSLYLYKYDIEVDPDEWLKDTYDVPGFPLLRDLWYDGEYIFITDFHGYGISAFRYKTITGMEFGYNLTGLNPGTKYFYRAFGNNSNSTFYGVGMNFTTLPGAIPDFVASNYNSTAVNLSWSSNSSVDSLYIRYSKTGYPSSRSSGVFLVNESTNTTYNHSGLGVGTSYYYRAWSWNDTSGWGDYSSALGYTNPGVPNSLQDTSNTTETISLSWNRGTNASRSVVFRNSSGVLSYPNASNGVEVINTTGESGTASGLVLNTTYYFSVYSFNPVSGLWSLGNDTLMASTSEAAGEVSNLVVTRFNDTQLNLSWVRDNVEDDVVIVRKTGSYPSNANDGTEVYNGSLLTYKDTGLTPATKYYYRAWAWNGEDYSSNYTSDTNITRPSPPDDFTGEISGGNLIMEWAKGTGASRTLIRNNTGVYPVNTSDGYLVYNGTGITTMVSGVSSIDYYRGWSYVVVDGEGIYSLSVDLIWGGLEINVYSETDNSIEIGNYTVFITNSDASETYQNTSGNNPFRIDVSDVPNGEDITVQVSKQGYNTRSQVLDMYENTWYTISFYLPPSGEGSPDDEQDEDWYVPPEEDETTLITDVFVVDDHTTDEVETLECSPDEVEMVYVYNSSIYGGWVEVASSNYTLVDSTLTINSSVFDANSTLIKVLYYCDSGQEYSSHYIITVKNNLGDYGQTIENAYVVIKRYINTSDSYETIISDYSDSNGQIEVDLIPDTVYYVNITKNGYKDMETFWTPSNIVYVEDAYKTFMLVFSQEDIDVITIGECISVNASWVNNSGYLYVKYADVCTNTLNVSLWLYEIGNYTTSFMNCSNYSNDNYFNYIVSGLNSSKSHKLIVFFNHSDFGLKSISVYINPYSDLVDESTLEDRFTDVFGDFELGWVKTLLIFLPCLFLLVVFGRSHVGLGVLSSGMYIGFSAMFIDVSHMVEYGTVAAILAVAGIVYIIATKGEKIL